ncbi:MAG: MFS transporter [Acidimicrobiaceae bacterium]|nr:MFS transporter [Acidimicrobiaceae bacterium]
MKGSAPGRSAGQVPESGPKLDVWAPLRHQREWVIMAASFSINLGVQYISPLLPAMRTDLHLTTVQVGWIVGGYSAPSLLLTLPLGILADFWGPKRMLVAALLVFGVSGVGTVTASTFTELLIWRIVQGVAFAPLATLTISLVADSLPLEHQAMAQSYRSVVSSGSEFVLPVLAGLVLAATGNWRAPFFLLVAPLGVAVWAALVLPRSHTTRRRERTGYTGRAASALREPPILGLTVGGFARWFLKYGFFAYMPLYLSTRVHASPSEIGYVIGIPGLVAAVVSSQAGRLGLGRRGKGWLMVTLALFGACIPGITLLPSVWWAGAVSVVMGVSDGILGPLLNSFISILPPPQVRVAVVSVSGLLRNIGKTVAPTVLGPLVLLVGYPAAFAVVGLVAVTAPAYLLPLYRRPDTPASSSSTQLQVGPQ